MQQHSSRDGWVQEDEVPYDTGAQSFGRVVDKRRHRFIIVDYPVLDALPTIGHQAFTVYCVLVRFMDRNRSCHPSWDRVQEKTGMGRNTVRKALRLLEKEGWIQKHQRRRGDRTGGPFSSNEYHICDMSEREGLMPKDTSMTTNGPSISVTP